MGDGLIANAAGVLSIDATSANEGDLLTLGPDGVEWTAPTSVGLTYTLGTSGNTVTLTPSTGSP